MLIDAGLGELQKIKKLRLTSWKKGYTGRKPDLLIFNISKDYNGFAMEFKTAFAALTPKGYGILSDKQVI